MNFPRISIVIPSYNQGQFLEETILSVINQQYSDLELFVVDGGSNDNSVDIIKKYESHIKWWVSEKDKGQSNAINKGFSRSTGDILTWLCSDDLLTPGSLKIVASNFSSANEKIGLIHGGAIVFSSDQTKETRFIYQTLCKEAYLSGMVFPQPAAFFRRSYLTQVGLLDESLHYGMDYDLFQRLSLVCDFLPVNNVFAKYRLHSQSKSVSESNRFITDWKKSYINMCKNLSWSREISYLEETGLFKKEIKYTKPYPFDPDPHIQSAIDKEKTLFFHLGHILKDLYWKNDLEQARNLRNLMKSDFKKKWWKEDPRLNTVAKKLNYPGFILKTLKSIKGIVGYK
jgi:glycosyltransferase involved in cell wall biosynthesis